MPPSDTSQHAPLPLALVLLDAQGNVSAVSPGFAQFLGCNPDRFPGQFAVDLIHPEERVEWAHNFRETLRAAPPLPDRSYRLRHQSGGWVSARFEWVRLEEPAASCALLLHPVQELSTDTPELLHLLDLAIEQVPAGVFVTDLAGRIAYVNPRFTQMTGYTAAEVLGRTPSLLKSGRTPPEVYQELWATIAAGEVWRGELCNRRKDGELYWHATSISPVRDAGGRPSGYVAVQEDITEQRRSADALAESEARYRQLVETAAEGIWGVDADHLTTYVSPRLAAMLGYSATEMLGRPVSDFTDDEGRAIVEWSRLRRRQGIREQIDFKLQRRDGTTFWALLSTGPVFDDAGRYAGALGMLSDQTARREAEAGLRQSEAWWRALTESAEDLVAVVGRDGTFTYASPSYERKLGYPPAELAGRVAFELVHPDDLDYVLRTFAEASEQDGSIRALRYRLRHADGSWRLIDGIGRNLFDDPVVAGGLIVGRDVTEHHALELRLRQSQKMEALGGLVGGVAHDFNNILTVILGITDMLRAEATAENPWQEDLMEIRKAGERGATLTRQLLAFTRQQVLVPRVLDLGALTANIQGMLARLLGEDIEIVLRPAPEPTLVMADHGQLEQVLLNLAANSRDAMPDGGTLIIETAIMEFDASSTVRHEPMQPGRYVMLAVGDTGVGMSEETQVKAFEPFFTTKPLGQGTGLGLSTVYGIVKQSGGFVWLYSEVGRGTTFKIYLPQVRAAALAEEPTPGMPASRGGTETILITEDNLSVRLIASRLLSGHGYTVLEADGAAAMEVAARHAGTIHLLLTDVVMPGISGPALAHQLREERPGLRVLYMSGYTSTHLTRIVESGEHFLQKPFALAELARKVRETLDAKASPPSE